MLGAHLSPARAASLAGLGVRNARRIRAMPPDTTPAVRERARALLHGSRDKGSTDEERTLALRWLNGEPPPDQDAPTDPVSAPSPCPSDGHVPAPTVADHIPASPVDHQLATERQQLHRKIQRRVWLLRQPLERQAVSDEHAAALLELVDDIAAASDALQALDKAVSTN